MPPVDPRLTDRSDSMESAGGGSGAHPLIPGRPVGPIALLLAAGIVAGLAAWLAGEAGLDAIKPARHPLNSRGIILDVVHPRDREIAEARNAGLAFSLLGASFGMCLGATGGLARRSGRAAILAATLGLASGAVACAAISMVVLPGYNAYRHDHPDEASRDLILPLLVHAAAWSAAGGAGGAAFAFGLGKQGLWPRAIVGGFVGAVVAAGVYELVGVAAFPSAGTTQFVSSTWPTRLLARLAVGSLAAAGIAVAVAPPGARPVTPAS